jgi:hypothetical protein
LASAAAIGAGLTLAACGGGSSGTSTPSNPVTALHDSLSSVTKLSGIGVRLSLGLTAAQLQQLATLDKSGGSISQAEAQAISGGSFFFEVSSGHGEALHSSQAASDSSNNFDVGLTLGSDTPIELRTVAQNIFIHLQIQTLLNDVGQSSNPSAAKITGEGSQLDTYVPGLSSLLSGNWAEITHASLVPLEGDLKGLESSLGNTSGSTSSANESIYKGDFDKLSRDVAAALKANSTSTKVGTTGGRTEYNVTVQVKPFVQAAATAVQNDLSSIPGGLGSKYSAGVNSATAKIPAGQTLVMQVFVASGKLSEVDLDINQFLTGSQKAPFAIPLKIAIIDNPSISAPSGATTLDLSKLPSLLSGLTGSK